MEAVGLNLPLSLLENNPPAHRLPACRRVKLRTQNAEKEKSYALPEQVCIWRKVCRKIALNVAPMQGQATKPLFAEVGQSGRALQQVISPEPGQAAETGLQAAGPIDADGVGILRPPVPPLAQNSVRVTVIARQPVRLGQGYEMLMAVQFPCDLAVTDFPEIQIGYPMKHFSRGTLAVHQVQVPVNRAVISEVAIT